MPCLSRASSLATSLAVLILRVWSLGRILDNTRVMMVPGVNLDLDGTDLDPHIHYPLWSTIPLIPRARPLNVDSTLTFPGASR